MAGKTDLDEAKAAMIAETAEEIFLLPVFGFFTEKDKEKQVCICICFLLLRRRNLVSGKNILEISITMEVFFQSAAVKKYATETMPNMMTRLENLVGEKGFFVGDQVSKIHSYSPN